MQVSSFMTDLMEFKDEIFKKVRLLENKLTTEFKAKYSEMYSNIEKIDNKLNYITESNESLLESVAEQKMGLEKVAELESFKNKTEHNIIMHDIRIKSMSSDLESIKNKYDKTIYDNLQVPGYVGPGCQFKTIAEYITNNIFELSKLKNDRDKMKIENVEIRNRLDNILKSTINLIDNSIVRCQKYSDNKHQDMQKILDNRLVEFSEKNIDILKTEIHNEKQIELLKLDVEKLLLMKNELITLTDEKIKEINNKIETMTKEISLMKLKKAEKSNEEQIKSENKSEKEEEYNYINSSNNISNFKNIDFNNSIKNNEEFNLKINTNINNMKKSNYKLQKNPMIISSSNNYNIKSNINEPNASNINNTNYIKKKLNINNTNSTKSPKYNKINYNNELKNLNHKKEEKKFELFEEEQSSRNIEKKNLNNYNNNKINIINNEYQVSKEETKEEMKEEVKEEAKKEVKEEMKVEEKEKIKEEIKEEAKKEIKKEIKRKNKIKEEKKNMKFIENHNQSPKNNEIIKKGKIIKNLSSPILDKPMKIDDIYTNNLNNNINIDYKNRELKDSIQIFSNKKKINTKKIKIESLEKKRYIQSNSSVNSNEIKNKKEEQDYNDYDYNEPFINNNILIEKISKSPLVKNFSKINIVNKKNNIEDYNFYLTPKSFNTVDRNERNERKNIIEYNEEQLQIMNKIKTFYNNKKEKSEQKSQENVIDCNVINLNLEKGLKNKKKQISENNLYLSKDNKFQKENKLRNNLSEIGMKITPAFGRTTYSFYNKREHIGTGFNNAIQNNRKINSLRDRLNMALVSTIKQRLNLHDKAINVK